jgi:hypothetical protein
MASTGKSTRPKDLAPYQRLAIDTIRQRALRMRSGAHDDISAVLERAGLRQNVYDDAVESVPARPRVALHFHPERLSPSGRSVAEGLLQDGVYKNQYDAGLSSGSPSAFPGGERDLWENRLFGGAYHGIDAASSGRPKYGALEVMDHPDGPAPRFGSCYFLLRPDVARRSTLTFGGSHEDCAPECTGTLEVLEPVHGSVAGTDRARRWRLRHRRPDRGGLSGANGTQVFGAIFRSAAPTLGQGPRQLHRGSSSRRDPPGGRCRASRLRSGFSKPSCRRGSRGDCGQIRSSTFLASGVHASRQPSPGCFSRLSGPSSGGAYCGARRTGCGEHRSGSEFRLNSSRKPGRTGRRTRTSSPSSGDCGTCSSWAATRLRASSVCTRKRRSASRARWSRGAATARTGTTFSRARIPTARRSWERRTGPAATGPAAATAPRWSAPTIARACATTRRPGRGTRRTLARLQPGGAARHRRRRPVLLLRPGLTDPADHGTVQLPVVST